MSVVLFALKPIRECNLSLFENGAFLDESIDYLNDKFGRMTIYLGGAHEARTAAAQPIAFNCVPDNLEIPQHRPVKNKLVPSETLLNRAFLRSVLKRDSVLIS